MERDTWNEVKPGTGAFVAELSTAEEASMLLGGSDMSCMDPADILEAFEEGSFEWMAEGE